MRSWILLLMNTWMTQTFWGFTWKQAINIHFHLKQRKLETFEKLEPRTFYRLSIDQLIDSSPVQHSKPSTTVYTNQQPPLSPGLFLYVSSGRGVLMAASFTACLSFFCSLRCFLATFCCFSWRVFSLFSSFKPLVFNRRRNVGRRFFDRGCKEGGEEGRQEGKETSASFYR